MESKKLTFLKKKKSQNSQMEDLLVACMHSYLKCEENDFPLSLFFNVNRVNCLKL